MHTHTSFIALVLTLLVLFSFVDSQAQVRKQPEGKPKKNEDAQTPKQKLEVVKDTRSWRGGYLKAAAALVGSDNHIVVTSGDWKYRLVVVNWMIHMEKLNITEYVVLCYDQQLLDLVGHWSVPGGHGVLCTWQPVQSLGKFALKHIGVNLLVEQGYITTWSDADCVWLRPFVETFILPYKGRLDIISSMGKHPAEISNVAGVASCIGLFTIFPTNASKYFYNAMLEKGLSLDDQVSFNYLLAILDGFYGYSDVVPYGHTTSSQVWINRPRSSAELMSLVENRGSTGGSMVPLAFGWLKFFQETTVLPLHSLRHGLLPYNQFPRGEKRAKIAVPAKSRSKPPVRQTGRRKGPAAVVKVPSAPDSGVTAPPPRLLAIDDAHTSPMLQPTLQLTPKLTPSPKLTLKPKPKPKLKGRPKSNTTDEESFVEMRRQWKVALRHEPCIWHLLSHKNGKSKTDSMIADKVYVLDSTVSQFTSFNELDVYMRPHRRQKNEAPEAAVVGVE